MKPETDKSVYPTPILYYITGEAPAAEVLARIRAAFAAGVDWVQVRQKRMAGRELADLVSSAVALPEKRGARLLVNERLDVALACGAGGVHLPADAMPAEAARRAAPPGWLVGVSCHSPAAIERAARSGADFAVLGPIYATPGKGSPLGLEPLRDACRRAAAQAFQVLALGGITPENALACLEAGASGIAGIRLFERDDVAEVVSRLHCGEKQVSRP